MKSLSRSDLLSVLLSKLVQISNPFPHADFLVPVPMHPRRIIKRGFNQAQWLAHHLSSTWSIPVLDCSLEKIAETSAQKFLTLRARRKNLKGVFCWSGVRCERTRIVLIDDVYTTGATLDACAKVIKGAGAEAVYGWTLFRTELKKNGGKILPTVSNS